MAYEVFPTDVPGPSYPIEKTAEPKVKRVEFGDGYTQEAPDGLNYNLYTWNLTWESLNFEERVIIEDFITARKGFETFLWTDPDGVQYRVKAKQWSISEFTPRVYKFSTTFKQVAI